MLLCLVNSRIFAHNRHVLYNFYAIRALGAYFVLQLIYLILEVDPLYTRFNRNCYIKQLILLIRFDELVAYCNCIHFSGKDVVDDIMANMIDQKKTRRQVIRQLAHLDLIGSAKDLKVRK